MRLPYKSFEKTGVPLLLSTSTIVGPSQLVFDTAAASFVRVHHSSSQLVFDTATLVVVVLHSPQARSCLYSIQQLLLPLELPQPQHLDELGEFRPGQRFGEDIGHVVVRWYVLHFNFAVFNRLTNKMIS